jgi:predicted transcriptional regulator of viral defense system
MQSKSNQLLSLASKKQIIRSSDAYALGIPRNYLPRLVRKGLITKVGRGLYRSKTAPVTEHVSLIEASCKVPKGVICLLSALRFHKFTTQSPHEVWMAIGIKSWAPGIISPPIRFVRMSGKALHSGMKEYPVRGGSLKVYTPAKTVADCFKFRNKIGIDVAMEALKECHRLKKATMGDIWIAAKICRVANVMRPHIESLCFFR